jgi:circadian clock protein KaiB
MPKKSAKRKLAKRKPEAITGDIPDNRASSQAYVFRLFVSGQTAKSTRAIDNIKRICEAYFPGQYQLEVVDVYQQPQLARGEQIVALPTLLKKAPGKLKKILGDLGNSEEFMTKLH